MAETIPSLDPFLKTADAPFHRNIETRGLMSSCFCKIETFFIPGGGGSASMGP